MAVKTVYNRDGSVYGELDTDKYLFNNTLIGSEPVKLDVELYPYVKVAGVYYKNDGEEWFTKSKANDSAGMFDKNSAYQWNYGKSTAWNYNKLLTKNKWVSITPSEEESNVAIMNYDFSSMTDFTVPSNTTGCEDYLVKATMLSSEVGGLATIPRYCIKKDNTLEAFEGFSFSSNRDETLDDGYFGIEGLNVGGTINSTMKHYGMSSGLVPILLDTNADILLSDLASGSYVWKLDYSETGKVKLEKTVNTEGVEIITERSWEWNKATDYVILYIRKPGIFDLTEGIPFALDYYKEISINPERTNTAGYLILSNQPYDEGPILCALYDKGKVINTKGKLEFNTIDDSNIKQQYDSNMLLYNMSTLYGSTTVKWGSHGLIAGNKTYRWDSKTTSDMFPLKLPSEYQDLFKSIIKTKTDTYTMPTIKNIADYHNQDAILDGNKHYMKLGKYDSSVENKVVRMPNGLNMSLSINNFPYIDLAKHSCSMSSSIGSSSTITTAGDCYGYVISARDTTNTIKEFEMICKGTLNNTYPGTYPKNLSMVDTPEIGPVYDGKWACYLDSIGGSPTLDNINYGWRNFGIRWEHKSGNGVRESISWQLSIGYENPYAENANYDPRCAFYLVLWKNISME